MGLFDGLFGGGGSSKKESKVTTTTTTTTNVGDIGFTGSAAVQLGQVISRNLIDARAADAANYRLLLAETDRLTTKALQAPTAGSSALAGSPGTIAAIAAAALVLILRRKRK